MQMASITSENFSIVEQAAPTVAHVGHRRVAMLDSSQRTAWNRFVASHSEGSIFHTMAWRDAVKSSFPHKDFYLTAWQQERIVGVLPLFLVASRLGGRMLVSVPYGVGGGILANDPSTTELLFTAAKALASGERCDVIDLRSPIANVANLTTIDRYAGFKRNLPGKVEDVLGWLPRKARAAARNARHKYGLTAHFGDENLREVWHLYTLGMRRLGSPCYSLRFFEQLITHTPGKHWVSLVRRNGHAVTGLVTFLHGDTVMPYFIGSTDEAKSCSAANFVYLTIMERAVAKGYRVFDFGRSRIDNGGSYDFKRFQGFEPVPLGYQYYTAPGKQPPSMSPGDAKYQLARTIWKRLPLWVTRLAGAQLTKHIPG